MHLNNMQIAAEVTYFGNLRNRNTQFFWGGRRAGRRGGGGEKMCAILLFGDEAVLLRRYDIRVKHMLESSTCSTFLCLSLMDFAAHGAGLPPPHRMEQPYRLAQSKRACLEQVYLIPGANWIHLKIQGQLVINCYPKKSTLLSRHRRQYLRRERPGAGRVTIRRVSNPRRSREVHFGSSGRGAGSEPERSFPGRPWITSDPQGPPFKENH